MDPRHGRLTKHTRRILGLSAGAALVVAAETVAGEGRLRSEWPSLVAVVVALVWAWAATDDYRSGTHRRIPAMMRESARTHPLGWYGRVVAAAEPAAKIVGWVVPASMYAIALAYLTGVAVRPAAAGAMVLLITMFLFLQLRHPRDDYVLLTAGQLVILVFEPAGLPALSAVLLSQL